MTTPETPADAPLDFSAPAPTTAPECVNCKKPITDQYWSIGDALLCESCKLALDRGQAVSTGITARTGRFAKAALYGAGGMIAGAAIWYAIAKLANLEIGLIAILLGWLVGRGVFLGSGKRGGRRYQVLSVLLTYMGIGLSYVPFAIEEMRKGDGPEASVSKEAPAPATAKPAAELTAEERAVEEHRLDSVLTAADSAAAKPKPSFLGSILVLLGIAIAGIVTLPVIVTIGGLPGSLISLLIYAFAIIEAWKLAREVRLPIEGPFRMSGQAEG